MSTVFYGYRIGKESLWPFTKRMREFYLDEHPTARVHLTIGEDASWEKRYAHFQALKSHGWFDAWPSVELQLFDFGGSWIFRVLERGHQFGNAFADGRFPEVEPVWLDTRSDGQSEEEVAELKPIVDRVEVMIRERHYFLWPVVNEQDWYEMVVTRPLQRWEERAQGSSVEAFAAERESRHE